jgi:hypothetical protein
MEPQFADELVLKGKLRISNLKSYSETSNLSILDRSEGKFMYQLGPKKQGRILKQTSTGLIDVTNDPKSVIKNFESTLFRQREMPDVYCISTSYSNETNLFKDYGACVEITNPNKFLNVIVEHLMDLKKIEQFDSENKKHWAIGGDIHYVEKKMGSLGKPIDIYFIKPSDPFIKEKEYRVILKPILTSPKEVSTYIDIELPELMQYCQRLR